MKESDFKKKKATNHEGGHHHGKVHKSPGHASKPTHQNHKHEQPKDGLDRERNMP